MWTLELLPAAGELTPLHSISARLVGSLQVAHIGNWSARWTYTAIWSRVTTTAGLYVPSE